MNPDSEDLFLRQLKARLGSGGDLSYSSALLAAEAKVLKGSLLEDWERELLRGGLVWVDEVSETGSGDVDGDGSPPQISFEQAVKRILNEVRGAHIESDDAVREEARRVLTLLTNEITAIVRRLDDGG